jgi:hypothetical protein
MIVTHSGVDPIAPPRRKLCAKSEPGPRRCRLSSCLDGTRFARGASSERGFIQSAWPASCVSLLSWSSFVSDSVHGLICSCSSGAGASSSSGGATSGTAGADPTVTAEQAAQFRSLIASMTAAASGAPAASGKSHTFYVENLECQHIPRVFAGRCLDSTNPADVVHIQPCPCIITLPLLTTRLA